MFDGPCPHGRASEFDCNRCSYDPSQIDRDALKARLEQSQQIYAKFITGQHEEALTRIELLTAALTELVQLYDGTHAIFNALPRSIACGPITKVFEDAHDRARAVLAAGETKPDKRDECGCHKGCTMLPHDCEKPCTWPDCLTEAEQQKLADDVMKDNE